MIKAYIILSCFGISTILAANGAIGLEPDYKHFEYQSSRTPSSNYLNSNNGYYNRPAISNSISLGPHSPGIYDKIIPGIFDKFTPGIYDSVRGSYPQSYGNRYYPNRGYYPTTSGYYPTTSGYYPTRGYYPSTSGYYPTRGYYPNSGYPSSGVYPSSGTYPSSGYYPTTGGYYPSTGGYYPNRRYHPDIYDDVGVSYGNRAYNPSSGYYPGTTYNNPGIYGYSSSSSSSYPRDSTDYTDNYSKSSTSVKAGVTTTK